MCGQFTTEQFGIGTCDDNVHFLSQHTIDEQMPSQDILYLIEEKILKVAVYLIQNLQHVVQLVCLEVNTVHHRSQRMQTSGCDCA